MVEETDFFADRLKVTHFYCEQIKTLFQQFKTGRKKKANRALNPKRSGNFSAKSNCGTTFP